MIDDPDDHGIVEWDQDIRDREHDPIETLWREDECWDYLETAGAHMIVLGRDGWRDWWRR